MKQKAREYGLTQNLNEINDVKLFIANIFCYLHKLMPGRSIYNALIFDKMFPIFYRMILFPHYKFNRKINSSIVRIDGNVSAVSNIYAYEPSKDKKKKGTFKKAIFF